jgi:hypothetical protein
MGGDRKMKALSFPFLALTFAFAICAGAAGDVIELFDDDDSFVEHLAQEDTPTTIENDNSDTFNGDISLNVTAPSGVTNGQRYNPNIPDWSYKIVENPSGTDEARWIMFAWKKIGGTGIMIQFPDNGGWGAVTTPFVDPPAPGTRRYIAGDNMTGWTGIQVSENAPAQWGVVIRDLFADFGEFTMTGIALTPFDNTGLYDSIYLARGEDELNNLLTTSVEPDSKLASTWGEVKSCE